MIERKYIELTKMTPHKGDEALINDDDDDNTIQATIMI